MTAEAARRAPSSLGSPQLPLVIRLAFRELRTGLSGFYIFVACIALGVAAIAGVGSLAGALETGLARQGQVILGGDAALRMIHRQASDAERRFLAGRGTVSEAATLRAMARTIDTGKPALVQIKATDRAHPLFGSVVLRNPDGTRPTIDILHRRGVAAVEEVLLARLGLKLGDTIRIGSGDVRIIALLDSEPDRLSGRPAFGPRVLMSLETLEATGLIQPGSLIRWHYRVRLQSSDPGDRRELVAFREALKARFPDGGFSVRDRSNPAPNVRQAVERFAQFLTLIGITTLLVGGVGVANAIATYIDRKRTVIAAFKCLGASSRVIFATYLLQILVLAGVGTGIGLGLGALAPLAVVAVYGDALPVGLALSPSPRALGLAALYGFLTALLFVLWPLGVARDLKPALLWRQAVSSERTRPRAVYILACAVCGLGLFGVAIMSTEAHMLAFYACLGLVGLFVVYLVLGFVVERVARRLPRPRTPAYALAQASLAGPGALARTVILSLGASLSLLAAVSLVNASLIAEFESGLPENAPSYFVLDIGKNDVDRFSAIVRDHLPEARLEHAPMLRGRVVSLKGVPAEQITASPDVSWVLNGDRGLTFANTLPKASMLVEGRWWPADYQGPPLVSVEAEIARGFGLEIGDAVTVNVLGRRLEAKVANLRTVDWDSLAINFVLVFSPNALEKAPFNRLATLSIPPDVASDREGRLVQTLAETFPHTTAIRVRDAIDAFRDIVGQVMLAVRAAGGLTLIVGAIVLAGALATSHRRRIREAVIFKTLGATRRQIVAAHFTEYAVLAAVAGVAALGLGTLAAYLVVTLAMNSEFTFSLPAALQAVGVAALLVLAFGAAGTWRVLGVRPVPYLRGG